MSPLLIMEIVDVIGHGGAQSHDGVPLSSVKQLGLHSTPKRLDHGVVIAIPDGSVAKPEAILCDVVRKCPPGELAAVVCKSHSPEHWFAR